MRGRRWTKLEELKVRQLKGQRTVCQIAQILGRSKHSVEGFIAYRRIVAKRATFGPAFADFLRRGHETGLTDVMMAEEWGCSSLTVSVWRRKLGIPNQLSSVWHRRRMALSLHKRCRANGVKNLAEWKAVRRRLRAAHAGDIGN